MAPVTYFIRPSIIPRGFLPRQVPQGRSTSQDIFSQEQVDEFLFDIKFDRQYIRNIWSFLKWVSAPIAKWIGRTYGQDIFERFISLKPREQVIYIKDNIERYLRREINWKLRELEDVIFTYTELRYFREEPVTRSIPRWLQQKIYYQQQGFF